MMPLTVTACLLLSLFRNKRFALNEIFQRNASNFLYFMYKKTHALWLKSSSKSASHNSDVGEQISKNTQPLLIFLKIFLIEVFTNDNCYKNFKENWRKICK